MKNKRILWITQTAIFIALLIISQAATAPLGNSLITGSIVNLLLIVSVMTCGIFSGLTVATVSPFMAKFIGIGPLWTIIPFIVIGNIVLVIIWHFIGNIKIWNKYISYVLALAVASVVKFLVLFISIVKIAIPLFLDLPAPQAKVISNMFSVPQFFTALIGGVVAIAIIPILKKAIPEK